MLPANPSLSFAYALATPFWRSRFAINSIVRILSSWVWVMSKHQWREIFLSGHRNRWYPEECWSLTRRFGCPFKCYRRSCLSAHFPVKLFGWLRERVASIGALRRQSPYLHVLLTSCLYAFEILSCVICVVFYFMCSKVSSPSSWFVPPRFLTTNQLAAIVVGITAEDVRRGRKQTPAIEIVFEATYYEVQIVSIIEILQERLSIVLVELMNSKLSAFDVYWALLLHQPNEDGTTASVCHFSPQFVALAPNHSQYAELSANPLILEGEIPSCSGNNRNKLCGKKFFHLHGRKTSLFDVTFLWVEHSSSLQVFGRLCFFAWAQQASYLADGLYHVKSRTARLQVDRSKTTLLVYM